MSVEALNSKNSTKEELNEFFRKEIKELANSVPEMSGEEIENLTGPQLYSIYLQSEGETHKDSYGTYILVNLENKKGKHQIRKLYYTLGKKLEDLKNGHTYISTESIEDFNIGIGRKVGNKIIGICANIGKENNKTTNIYKGDLEYKKGGFLPKK